MLGYVYILRTGSTYFVISSVPQARIQGGPGVRTPPPLEQGRKKKEKERKKKEKNVQLDQRQRFCWSDVNRFDRGEEGISC